MNSLKLYQDWVEARFLERPNRFTLLLDLKGRRIRAYLPNTGRLEEYLVQGGVFYLTHSRTSKFAYRAVSSCYQNFFVLLDTQKVNDIVDALLREKRLPDAGSIVEIRREKTIGDLRPDFLLKDSDGCTRFLEVKTCTLCRNGVALFPDAPSIRACRHIERLRSAVGPRTSSSLIIIVPSGGARVFMPNFHTDMTFAERFLRASGAHGSDEGDGTSILTRVGESGSPVPPRGFERAGTGLDLRALGVTLTDPVTVDLDSLQELPIEREKARANATASGSYLLVLKNERAANIEVGHLGTVSFRRGYYVYVGSALGSLEARVARHARARKKKFWHIDYITPEPMSVEKIFTIRRLDRIEPALAARIASFCDSAVERFGASDSPERSHLFFYKAPPHRMKPFMDALLDFRTFTEGSAH